MDTKLYGAAATYWKCCDREVLCESGARTGKSHSELVKAKYLCETYPNARGLFVRLTRASMTESVLPDWENKVLGPGHPAVGKARRDNRSSYHFPGTNATIVLGGLDNADRFLSAEYDFFIVFQCEELRDREPWDTLMSRLSGQAIRMCGACQRLVPPELAACGGCGGPTRAFTQATADANPSPIGPRHWLLKRAKEVICLVCAASVDTENAVACPKCGAREIGRMRHLQFRHQDNPRWFDHEKRTWHEEGRAYLIGVLGRLRGAKRKQLRDHLWVAEEGQVLEDYDEEIHRITGRLEQGRGNEWDLHITSKGWSKDSQDPMRRTPVRLRWFGCGADWGFWPNPAVFQVWGYDEHARRFRVVEVYKTKQQMQWWADVAEALWKEFRYEYIAVDPSAKALLELFNQRLANQAGHPLAVGADNTIKGKGSELAGIDLVRWGIKDPDGVVRTFFLRDATRYGVDLDLREASRPTCTEEEIPSWVFLKRPSGIVEEIPDPRCDDHGTDAARYEAAEGWLRRMPEKMATGNIDFKPGTFGHALGHAQKMAKARAWREQQEGGIT